MNGDPVLLEIKLKNNIFVTLFHGRANVVARSETSNGYCFSGRIVGTVVCGPRS